MRRSVWLIAQGWHPFISPTPMKPSPMPSLWQATPPQRLNISKPPSQLAGEVKEKSDREALLSDLKSLQDKA